MDTKPTYTKFHDFANGSITYTVKHPLFTEAKLYPDVRHTEEEWLCYLPGSDAMYSGGKSRKAAVEGMLKYAEKLVRGARLCDAWYELEQKLVQSSTAWHALYSGRENADDTVAEGNVDDNSTEYWELAWSGYNSLMDELESRERQLAETHNLIDLPVCNWCGLHAAEAHPINGDEVFCNECMPIAKLSHEFDALDEEMQESKDAKRAAAERADETVEDFNPKQWFEVALAQYTAMTGEPTSVAQSPVMAIDAPKGAAVTVTGTGNGAQVTISFATGVKLGHLWLRADNAARKWAKEFGGGRKLIRVSSGGTHTPQAEEHRFIYLWVI